MTGNRRQTSQLTNAIIAVFVGLLVAASLRSFGSPVQGFGDDVVMAMFSLAVLIFIGVAIWFAISSLGSGGGSGGSSGGFGDGGGEGPRGSGGGDLARMERAMNERLDRIEGSVAPMQGDVSHMKGVLERVDEGVSSLVAVQKEWGPKLTGLVETCGSLRTTVDASIPEIKAKMSELDKWRSDKWPQFTRVARKALGAVHSQGRALAAEVQHLRTESSDIKKSQSDLDESLRAVFAFVDDLSARVDRGFRDVPGRVDVAIQGSLVRVIDAVAEDAKSLAESMRDDLVKRFAAEQKALADALKALESKVGGLPAEVQALVVAQVGEVKKQVDESLKLVAQEQANTAVALGKLLEMRKELTGAWSALSSNLGADVVNRLAPRIADLQKYVDEKISNLQKGQAGMTRALRDHMTKIGGRVNAFTKLKVSEMQGEVMRRLQSLSASIQSQLDPLKQRDEQITAAIQALTARMAEMAAGVRSLDEGHVRQMEAVNGRLERVSELLGAVQSSMAKQESLDQLGKDVAAINAFLQDRLPESDKGKLAAIEGMVGELKRLLLELQKTRVEIRETVEKHAAEGEVELFFAETKEHILAISESIALALDLLNRTEFSSADDRVKFSAFSRVIRSSFTALCEGDSSILARALKLKGALKGGKRVDELVRSLGVLSDAYGSFAGSVRDLEKARDWRPQLIAGKARRVLDVLASCKELSRLVADFKGTISE